MIPTTINNRQSTTSSTVSPRWMSLVLVLFFGTIIFAVASDMDYDAASSATTTATMNTDTNTDATTIPSSDTDINNDNNNQKRSSRTIHTVVQDATVVDSSWPTLHEESSDVFRRASSLHTKLRYREYMHGCFQDAGAAAAAASYQEECEASERVRIARNRNQPPTMLNVTTPTGYYQKLPIPSSVHTVLHDFWKKNRQFAWTEFWQGGSTIRNHWQQSSSVLDIGRKDFPHHLSSHQLQHIVTGVQQVLEESIVHQPLVLTASVGIRAYLGNTIVAPHVDRLPFVITAVLHVAQHNIDEPWPLQLVLQEDEEDSTTTGQQRKNQLYLKNVTSVPGEMIVYEGTSVIHGRPYPLQAGGMELGENDDPTYMAVLYLHFEPVGYTMQHALRQQHQQQSLSEEIEDVADELYYYEAPTTTKAIDKASHAAFERALAAQQDKMKGGDTKISTLDKRVFESKEAVPRYVWETYRDAYQQKFVYQHEPSIYPKPSKVVFGQITAHQAAALGDLLALKSLAAKDRTVLFKADANGWRPLHEAARSGYTDVIEYLLEEGAQVNARTNNGAGGTALYWAEKEASKNSKGIAILKKYGGVNIAPEYRDD